MKSYIKKIDFIQVNIKSLFDYADSDRIQQRYLFEIISWLSWM